MSNFFKKGSFFNFRKTTPKTGASSFTYKPHDPLRQAEADLTKRFSFLFVLIILLFVVLYLWGVPMVAAIGSFWQGLNPSFGLGSSQNENQVLAAPRLDPLPSHINDFSKLKVNGWSQKGAKIETVINDEVQKETIADSSGRFEAGDLVLKEGVNSIYAKVKKGKTEAKSSVQQIIFSKTPPQLEISEPTDNQEVTDSSKNWVTVVGKTNPNVIVTINDHQAILDLEGNFKYQYLLSLGDNRLTIKAVDEAGNQSVVEKTVKFSPPPTIRPSP